MSIGIWVCLSVAKSLRSCPINNDTAVPCCLGLLLTDRLSSANIDRLTLVSKRPLAEETMTV